jgi:N-acetylglucosamine-6-phosphate deacetylase
VIVDAGAGRPPTGALDLGDALLAPGFVDLQVNGVDDVDFAALGDAAWRRAAAGLLSQGVTACCPTLVSAPLDAYEPALRRVGTAASAGGGPEILGVHLEGPFLGGAPGAHPTHLLRDSDPDWLGSLLDAVPDAVALVTLAPERDRAFAATTLLRERGVVVALGHSTASYAEACAAADAGATIVTHLFNGMRPFHHREPGLVGAALDDDRLTPTLIADLVHVHPAALRLAIARKRHVALVTDAVAVGAGGDVVVAPEGGARRADGTLVGSTLSMDRAVHHVVGLGVPVERAIEMAATVPAEALGRSERGRLEPGCVADVVALDPISHDVRAVWRRGARVI